MPTVWLDRDESEYGELPPVCMRCGAEATTTRGQTFAWHPPWVYVLLFVGVLPWAVVASILTKRMKLKAPLCEAHARHWARFKLFLYAGILAALGVLFAGIVMMTRIDQSVKNVGAGLLAVGGVGFLAVLIAAAVWQTNLIRAVEITDDDMRLKGVCEEFRQALREQRRQDREAEAYERGRKRRARYRDE